MPYHHGNLRESLIEAAADVAAAEGPDAVSLREVARTVGVSHNAAYRHFADRDALMRAVAVRAMTRFGELMARRIDEADGSAGDDPVENAYARFAASGRAYVEFAAEHRGLFRTAMTFPFGAIQPAEGVPHPYVQLGARLDELVTVGAITPERRAHAEIAACSAVHGFAMLWQDGPFGHAGEADRDRELDEVLRVVRFGV
ncbi:TetR/AcrR family transcriptional regulator [Jatrophihabitans endophyticus]|uniref:TetR/AcrR family transcriptional regulator n=1 Tax=Jatrophihabitans endophyticus TaxID=1206085 RepID=UPI001A02E4AA|nr:TetR/AcrR family transcriptional regulator [Jatrophihabitans endophyticus]MBE7189443.1 TetR/AcrR family transcriptional regulator [Jatrophihabitans endophyticus]